MRCNRGDAVLRLVLTAVVPALFFLAVVLLWIDDELEDEVGD